MHGIQPCLRGGFQVRVRIRMGDEGASFLRQALPDGLLGNIHTVAMLGVVFKQRVGPSGTVAILVGAVRRCGSGSPLSVFLQF